MTNSIRIRCLKCQSVVNVTIVHDAYETMVKHCVFCGGDIRTGEDDGDYWTTLALEFNTPKEVIKTLFDTWSPYDGDPPRFIDFARQALADLTQEEG